ncbi:MAG: hypothetical protein IK020_11120 [Clostridiales bacterium]|nr:hypothetical protein [Clostridiales bacterium]
MRTRERIWTVITLVLAAIAMSLIVTSVFAHVPFLLIAGLALLVLGQMSYMHLFGMRKRITRIPTGKIASENHA